MTNGQIEGTNRTLEEMLRHLDLPEALRIDNVLSVASTCFRWDSTAAFLYLVENKKQVEVDCKLRRQGSKREFFERWLGYGPEHNSWE